MDKLSAEDEAEWWAAYDQFPFAVYWVCPGCGMENDRGNEETDDYAETVMCGGCPARVPWPFPRREDREVLAVPPLPQPAWVEGPLQCILCLADVCVLQSQPGVRPDLALVACADCYLILLDVGRAARTPETPVAATSSGGWPCPPAECHTPCDEGGDAIARFRFPEKTPPSLAILGARAANTALQ